MSAFICCLSVQRVNDLRAEIAWTHTQTVLVENGGVTSQSGGGDIMGESHRGRKPVHLSINAVDAPEVT